MKTAYLGLGSNQGDRLTHLQAAVEGLSQLKDVHVCNVSPVYETEAHTLDSGEEQPAFLNAVVEVKSTTTPAALLDMAHTIERSQGRTRRPEQKRWAPRPLDIDLLAFGDVTRRTASLSLPHPRLADRRFVLVPWADLAPDFIVPAPFNASVRTLLKACSDSSTVKKTDDVLVVGAPFNS